MKVATREEKQTVVDMKSITSITRYFNVITMRKVSWSLIRGILVTGICFIILYPLLVKISSAFMEVRDVYDLSVQWIPRRVTFENFRMAYRFMFYPEAFMNSLSLTFIISILQLISCTLIGYGFARFQFRGNQLLFVLVIATLVVPPQMIMIPLFLNFRFFDIFGLLPEPGLNLIGTYWPFILTAITGTGLRNGLFIYIIRQYFKGMPKDLEEAAYVDGAGYLLTFSKVMLPGAIPVLVIVFLFSFVWQWNDIFYTNLYMRDGGRLMAFTLDNMAGEYNSYMYVRYGHTTISPELRGDVRTTLLDNAGMVLFILPLLMLYAFMQKYFIESVQRTGIVG